MKLSNHIIKQFECFDVHVYERTENKQKKISAGGKDSKIVKYERTSVPKILADADKPKNLFSYSTGILCVSHKTQGLSENTSILLEKTGTPCRVVKL